MALEKSGIAIWLSAIQLVISAALFLFAGSDEAGIRLWIRVTAWMSAALFVVAFAARPLRQFVRNDATRFALANRRYIGIAAAFAHFIHGIGIVWLMTAYPGPGTAVDIVTAIGGGLGFAFYFAMGLTSNDASVEWLGRENWKKLHTVGGYYVWGIFAFTSLGGVGENWRSAVMFLAFVAVLALRIAARMRKVPA